MPEFQNPVLPDNQDQLVTEYEKPAKRKQKASQALVLSIYFLDRESQGIENYTINAPRYRYQQKACQVVTSENE
jgi:hypothetical protein